MLHQLRSHSASTHAAMHEHPLLTALLRGEVQVRHYAGLLSAFTRPWSRLHASLEKTAAIPELVLPVRNRHKDLCADLFELSNKKQPPAVAGLTRCEALGYAYTLIGSSQGAPTLRKAVCAALPDPPIRFLSSSPRAAGWQSLVQRLETESVSDAEAVLEAAMRCFEEVRWGFDQALG